MRSARMPTAPTRSMRRAAMSGAGGETAAFDSVTELPADGYVPTSFSADTANAGLGKWYEYSMWSHLLTSKHHVYAIRTAAGERAKLEILAYYCREVGAACYTIRYKKARPRV